MESNKKNQTAYETKNKEPQDFIQHSTLDEGEREGVEQTQSGGVLQIEPGTNSFTTQQDTSSQQTKSFDSTSGQEAFYREYQPVEILNREGEWIKGYWVHKCLVVANLERIERKWSLCDERGEKYAFLGEIRLPRVE